MSLVIENVSKSYDSVKALNNVRLTIPRGMYGLLGPNGAGKSSLMRTIATLQDPDSGTIHFNGIDVVKDKTHLRMKLGYLPQEFGVYPKVSAEDLLDYLCSLKGIVDTKQRKQLVAHLLEMTNLSAHKKKAVSSYSGGMKQRFGVAQALIGDPELLIVDEPTAGLDPDERLRFLNILSEVALQKTIIFSTHIVSDIVDLCQKFAILFQGEILCEDSPQEALQRISSFVWQKPIAKEDLPRYMSNHKVLSTRLTMGKTFVRIFSPETPGDDFKKDNASLEDFYFAKTKRFLS